MPTVVVTQWEYLCAMMSAVLYICTFHKMLLLLKYENLKYIYILILCTVQGGGQVMAAGRCFGAVLRSIFLCSANKYFFRSYRSN